MRNIERAARPVGVALNTAAKGEVVNVVLFNRSVVAFTASTMTYTGQHVDSAGKPFTVPRA